MRTYRLTINDRTFSIAVRSFSSEAAELDVDGTLYNVRVDRVISDAEASTPSRRAASIPPVGLKSTAPARSSTTEAGAVTAPIPGLILEVFVREGDEVTSGQPVLKLEAMKMETVINAPSAGTIGTLRVRAGDAVSQGQELMVIV